MDIIEKILESHNYLNLATVTPTNHPRAATVSYASKGTTVYFSTGNSTEKYKNIQNNPFVAFTVDEDTLDWGTISGLQVIGRAVKLEDDKEKEEVQTLLECKFPQLMHLPKNIDSTLFKIEPERIFILDNTKGFGHRDKVIF